MKHVHEYRKGRGSVDVCSCGAFRHNEKAGPAIVEVPVKATHTPEPWAPEATVKGCGKRTHVAGTNGGTMPCGAMLTMLGETKPYYCAKCQPAELPRAPGNLAERQRDALLAALKGLYDCFDDDGLHECYEDQLSIAMEKAHTAIAAVESGKALPNANDEVPS